MAAIFTLTFAGCTTTPPTDGGATATTAAGGDTAPADASGDVTTAAGGAATPASDIKIGISMPEKNLERWLKDGASMKSQLEAKGYEVILNYADDDSDVQINNIQTFLNSGVNIIVVAPVDGNTLTPVLQEAADEGIPVISYDRLVMGSDAVSYYATFDLEKVGRLQAQYIADALDLENQTGPFNIELFAGDPGDNNAPHFFKGSMEILQPYIDSGKLVVKSGQTTFEACATTSWSQENAQARMENLLAGNYGDAKVDAVLAGADTLSRGAATALIEAGYNAGDGFPIITGQDCEVASVKAIISGTQTMSVFKDTRKLAGIAATMVDAIAAGTAPETNAESDNGVKSVPTFNCDPINVDKTNYQKEIIDSGYLTEADIA